MNLPTMRIVLGFLALAALARADNEEWSGWRRPRRDGTSHESGFPLRWSATEGVLWKVPIPGKGHSSPVVWGDRVFVTTCVEDGAERKLLCLDARDGHLLWDRVVVTVPKERKHGLNSYASATPVTDGKFVWVTFLEESRFSIFCYDLDGKLAWKKSPGEFHSVHGFCSSPLLYKDMVILNGDQDATAYIVALDKSTGAEKYRIKREGIRSYTPPVIFEAAGKKQMVVSGSNHVHSYDPDTGKEIWVIDGPTEQFVASLVCKDDMFFMTYGFPKLGVIGVKADGVGNITKSHVLYNETKGGGYVPSPIAHGDYFFNVSDKGVATCRFGKTGELKWEERLSNVVWSGSPVSVGDLLYYTDDEGVTFVIKAGPKFELVQKNTIGEKSCASFAVSRGQFFIRGEKNLFCIGKK